MSFTSDLKSTLADLPEYSVISMRVDTDNYFPAIITTLDTMVEERDFGGVYVASTRPAKAILHRVEQKKITAEDIMFVDCITYSIGGTAKTTENISYVESSTMLENVMLKTTYHASKLEMDQKFVIFDSLNSLAIYNDSKILSEFFHIIVNKLRTKDVFTIVLSVGHDAPGEVERLLDLICDETLDLRRPLKEEG